MMGLMGSKQELLLYQIGDMNDLQDPSKRHPVSTSAQLRLFVLY